MGKGACFDYLGDKVALSKTVTIQRISQFSEHSEVEPRRLCPQTGY